MVTLRDLLQRLQNNSHVDRDGFGSGITKDLEKWKRVSWKKKEAEEKGLFYIALRKR